MTQIPLIITTGFLGSGKTTLLHRLIDYYAGATPALKIAVVQNDFGEINIDASEIRQTYGDGFEVMEVNNGSLFCLCLLGSFQEGLSAFARTHRPDLILIESSGLADPVAIRQLLAKGTLQEQFYVAQVWCVVDATRYLRQSKAMPMMRHQIAVSDTVLINKCDDISAQELQTIRTMIAAIHPYAAIHTTSHCRFEAVTPADRLRPADRTWWPSGTSSQRPPVDTVVLKTPTTIPRPHLEAFLRHYAPLSFRIKGFVRTDQGAYAIQCVGEQTTVIPLDAYRPPYSCLVLLGIGLDAERCQAHLLGTQPMVATPKVCFAPIR